MSVKYQSPVKINRLRVNSQFAEVVPCTFYFHNTLEIDLLGVSIYLGMLSNSYIFNYLSEFYMYLCKLAMNSQLHEFWHT